MFRPSVCYLLRCARLDFIRLLIALLFYLAVPTSPANAVEAQEFLIALNEGPDAVQELLDQGLDPNETIAGMGTPFMLAVSQEKLEVIKLLAKAGADVNKTAPPMNISPLGAAASFGSADTIALLLELGANPNQPQPGFAGQTPLSMAKMSGKTRLVTLLEDAGNEKSDMESESSTPVEIRPAKWRVPHQSDTYSPVVTGAGIAVTSADKAFIARSLKDGTELWRFELDLTSSHGSPSNTLSLNDDTVYFAGGQNDAHFYAVDAQSGNLRWKFYTGGEVWKPPMAVGGTVYAASLYLGGNKVSDRGVYVWIVDKKTGLELARTFIRSDSTLLSPPKAGHGLVYITVNNVLTAIDAVSGQIRWQFHEEDTQYFDEAFSNVMLSSGSDDVPTVAVTAQLRNGRDQAMYLFDALVGRLKNKVAGTEWVHNATIESEHIYTMRTGQEAIPDSQLFAPKIFLSALDAQTGEQRWQFALDYQGKPWKQPPAVSDDSIYYWTQGYLHAIDRNTGQRLWRFDGDKLSDYRDAKVMVGDGAIYLWASPWLYAIDAASGQAKWGHPIEVYTDGDVAFEDNMLVFKNRNAELVAIATSIGPEASR